MIRSEYIPVTMPEEFPTANKNVRIDPNDKFPVDGVANVFTDDGHLFSFRMFKKGPQQKDYLISLMDSKPPITTYPPDEKEIYVKDDIIIEGREFTIDSMFPIIIGRTTFRAIQILTNVETIAVPLDGRPAHTDDDVKEQ
jgi:hypothetical protein